MNRKYDLDYLTWLQKNSRLYMAGLALLTLFIVVSWCLYFEPWQPQGQVAFWNSDSDQAVAEQQLTAPDEAGKEIVKMNNNTALQVRKDDESLTQPLEAAEQAETVNSESQHVKSDKNKKETAEAVKDETVDLLTVQNQLAGFAIPCDGEIAYAYGFGYNPVYKDYRFHDHLCYQAGGSNVKAAADGIVQRVDFESDWQLVLDCGIYQIRYQGLTACTLLEGECVGGGEIIGTAEEYLKVQTVEQ